MRALAWLCVSAASGVLLLALACAPVEPPRALTKITASYSERVGSYLALVLAADQGIFKKHGLDAELLLLTGATIKALAKNNPRVQEG